MKLRQSAKLRVTATRTGEPNLSSPLRGEQPLEEGAVEAQALP